MNAVVANAQQGTKKLPLAVILAGPTCSGKSYLALQLAQALRGVVINADAMQCYRELRIITARPSVEDEQLVPHRLYGGLASDQTGSAGWWRTSALAELDRAWQGGQLPILCGGTGMYFQSLVHGIADIPEPTPKAREEARQIIAMQGPVFLHEQLTQVDPITAQGLNPTDSQRIARAWEVWRSTGYGLKHWQKEAHLPGAACRFVVIRLAPPRDTMRQAVAERFKHMVELGAVEEVANFMKRRPSAEVPLRKALGVPEFIAHLSGDCSLPEAIARAVTNTQRYIKRQDTWFSNRTLASEAQNCIFNSRIDDSAQDSQRFIKKSLLFIKSFIDEV